MKRWGTRLATSLCAGALLIECVGGAACERRHATAQDCAAIFDRIVELELAERGFGDPLLLDRKQRQLRATLSSELNECRGKPVKPDALACVRTAKDTETLSHQCLR